MKILFGVTFFYGSLFLFWTGTTTWNLYEWHDQQRIAQICLLFIIFLSQIILLREKDCDGKITFPFFPSALSSVLLIGFVICGLASSVQAKFMAWAFLEWALLFLMFLGAGMIVRFRRVDESQFDRRLLILIVIVCVLYLFGFLGRYATLFSGLPLRVWDMFFGFANLRFFGQFQTMTLPLLTVLVMATSSALKRWSSFTMMGGWWMLSIASGTRGTWLAMAVAMTAVWLIGRPIGRSWVRWQFAAIAAGLMLYGLMFFAIPTLLDNQPKLINRLPALSNLSLRDVLWVEAWHMICAHPWFGIGPMQFAAQPNGIGAHPHNAVLQIAAEWGLPAMLMLSVFIVIGFCQFVNYLRRQSDEISFDNALSVALFGSLVAAGAQSLVDGVIVMPYSQVTLMVLAGWAIGICSSSSALKLNETSVSCSRWKEIAFQGFSALLLGIVMVQALPDVPYLPERTQHYSDAHPGQRLLPRFWQQGWINE